MADKDGPKQFQNECFDVHYIHIDNHDAAAMQLPENANAGPLVHRSSVDNGRTLTTPGRDQQTGTSMTLIGRGERTPQPLPETTRSKPNGGGIEGCTQPQEQEHSPLSCPDVSHDSESPPEPEMREKCRDTDHLAGPSEGNRVRKRSPTVTARSTSGHASQACESSNKLPLSSSENAEEQGEDAEHDGPRKPKSSSGRQPAKKRRK